MNYITLPRKTFITFFKNCTFSSCDSYRYWHLSVDWYTHD